MARGFTLMARLRPLRGTPLDIFGYHPHRRAERQLIRDYTRLVDEVLADLTPANIAAAEAALRAHDKIRGYDVIKEAHAAAVRDAVPGLLAAMKQPEARPV
jgi:indolepyruvate ferredoxin oxidoreductase